MLEGLAYSANPNFNVVDLVYPYVVSKVITGAEGTPFRSSLRNLVVDTGGGPGYERVKLIALERLVRLSQPGVLTSETASGLPGGSAADAPSREQPSRDASVVRFAFSRPGALVLELTVGQYLMDATAVCNAWIDRVLLRRAEKSTGLQSGDDADGSSPQANVAVVHRVLRRERRAKLGLGVRTRLVQLKWWILFGVAMRVTARLCRRFLRFFLRRPVATVSNNESLKPIEN